MLKINELKSLSLADECKWDDMNTMLLSSTFQNDLDKSCAIIKNKLLSLKNTEAYTEIGFNWGSCAYRHCGALADAQEAIAELSNSLGLYEPFECLFTIDVIERSVRDIYAVIPNSYKNSNTNVPDYILYQSSSAAYDNDESEYDAIDMDLINALKNVRNDDLSFGDDDE